VICSNQLKHHLSTGIVTTFAGNGRSGHADGISSNAMFNYPTGVAFDTEGNLFVSEWTGHRIRKITKTGMNYFIHDEHN
jgi:hypothetical protein